MLNNFFIEFGEHPVAVQQRLFKAKTLTIFGNSLLGDQYGDLADALAHNQITLVEFDQRLDELRQLDRIRKVAKNRAALRNLEELRNLASENLRRLEVSV